MKEIVRARFCRIAVAVFLAFGSMLCHTAVVSAQSMFWEYGGAPTAAADVTEIVVDPRDDGVWYVAADSGLFITWNFGDSWTQIFDGVVGAVAIDPNNPDVVYASTSFDLYRSDDQGLSWGHVGNFPDVIPGTPQNAPTFIDSILVSSSEGTLLVGQSTTFHSARVYKTEDGGSIWEVVFESPYGLHIWDLAEVPSNGAWFFCTEDSAHAVSPTVMRSMDRGASWEELTTLTGVPTSGHGLDLEVHPWSEVVYFLSEATVLRYSLDIGETWSNDYAGRGFGVTLLLDPACPNRVLGGEMVRGLSQGGVFASDNGSATFTFEGLAGHSISSLALSGSGTRVFAASYGSGIWIAEIDGILDCTHDVLLLADGFESGDTYRWTVFGAR